MPVILDPADYDLWLDPGMKNGDALSEMLKPYDVRMMRCYPVSGRVNHVANEDAEGAKPIELGPAPQGGCFEEQLAATCEETQNAKDSTADVEGPEGDRSILGSAYVCGLALESDGMPVRKQGRYVETHPTNSTLGLGKNQASRFMWQRRIQI